MATIKKTYTASSLPVAFSRGEPIPIDKSLVWYSLEELQAYVQSPTCYVGQILSLVDEATNTATVYVIADANGTLKEAGAATLGDDKTISLDTENGVLSLKNWGVEYYKWVDATGDDPEDPDYVAGHHEKQVVDETHPWIAGLEPKAIAGADGTFEIAWYQPSATTVEGLSSTVGTLQTSVNEINSALGDAATEGTIRHDIAGKLDLAGGTMTGDIILTDGGKAISDTAVANLIASAGHLVRSVVDELPEAGEADADTIYMVKDATATGDQYKEFMLIDGALVQIGDTSVDLEPYAKTDAVEAVAGDLSTHTADTDIHITAEERTAWNAKLDAEEGKVLVPAEDATKLSGLANIKSVGDGLTLDAETGALASVAKPASEVAAEIADDTTIKAEEGKLVAQLATADNAGIISAEDFTKIQNIEAGAQVNKIEKIMLGDEEAEITEKTITLPIATGALLGLVKGSDEDNKIRVEEDGTMVVNRISAMKIYVDAEDELILSGGGAE